MFEVFTEKMWKREFKSRPLSPESSTFWTQESDSGLSQKSQKLWAQGLRTQDSGRGLNSILFFLFILISSSHEPWGTWWTEECSRAVRDSTCGNGSRTYRRGYGRWRQIVWNSLGGKFVLHTPTPGRVVAWGARFVFSRPPSRWCSTRIWSSSTRSPCLRERRSCVCTGRGFLNKRNNRLLKVHVDVVPCGIFLFFYSELIYFLVEIAIGKFHMFDL